MYVMLVMDEGNGPGLISIMILEVQHMYAWEAIQKTLDYMEEHIDENPQVEELAAIAALSPFYYQRLFSRLVKKPVREYNKLRRLARACMELADKNRRILDIALDCGFSGHETFTRAFKAAYGMTPEQFREQPVLLNQFDKPNLLLHYTMVDEGVPLISDGLVLEMNHRLLEQPVCFVGIQDYVPIAGQMPPGETTGTDIPGRVWERFHRDKERIARVPGGREAGVSFLGDAPAGHFTYFAGAETGNAATTDGFATWTLPAREYVVCSFEACNFTELTTVALNKAIQFSQLWLDTHNLTMEMYSPEIYTGSDPETTCMELWLPTVPKNALQ